MPLSVTTSMAASSTVRRLGNSVEQATADIRALSTGKRVNSASDDVAASAVAARLSAEVAGLKQAGINAAQASSLVQIADGAYNNIEDNLIRAKELAIQAGSDSLSDTERGFLNTEFQELLDEIDRIANDTKFNGNPLIDRARQTFVPFGTDQLTGLTTTQGGTGTFTVNMSVTGQGLKEISFQDATLTDGTDVIKNGQAFSSVQSLTFAAINLPGPTPSNVVLNVNNVMIEGEDGSPTTANFVVNAATVAELTVMSGPTEAVLGVTMATSIALPNVVAGLTGSALLNLTSAFELRIPNSPPPMPDVASGTIAVIGEPNRQFDIKVGTGARPAADEIALALGGATTHALEIVGADIASKSAADEALRDVDRAIDTLQERRAGLAAAANRLEQAENNVQLVRENEDAARAELEELNVALRITSFSQKQLLIQSGTATLAQIRDLSVSLLTGLLANNP